MDLHDFVNSDYWQMYQESISIDMPFTDPERYDRMMEAAEYGGDGSTHAEAIQDQRDGVESMALDGHITEQERDHLLAALDAVEKYHYEHGTLYDEIG